MLQSAGRKSTQVDAMGRVFGRNDIRCAPNCEMKEQRGEHARLKESSYCHGLQGKGEPTVRVQKDFIARYAQ